MDIGGISGSWAPTPPSTQPFEEQRVHQHVGIVHALRVTDMVLIDVLYCTVYTIQTNLNYFFGQVRAPPRMRESSRLFYGLFVLRVRQIYAVRMNNSGCDPFKRNIQMYYR
jgi:hypothetical protein